jgi:hypothetical protein
MRIIKRTTYIFTYWQWMWKLQILSSRKLSTQSEDMMEIGECRDTPETYFPSFSSEWIILYVLGHQKTIPSGNT